MLPNLRFQIFLRGSRQNELARAVGIDETVLSKIIHGYRIPTPTQRRLLASYLEADENWLFERFEAVPLAKSEGIARTDKAADNDSI